MSVIYIEIKEEKGRFNVYSPYRLLYSAFTLKEARDWIINNPLSTNS